MLKVVLRYTDCRDDGRIVFAILAKNAIEILKTERKSNMYPEITIKVSDHVVLNDTLYKLNEKTSYGVSIKKTKIYTKPKQFKHLWEKR